MIAAVNSRMSILQALKILLKCDVLMIAKEDCDWYNTCLEVHRTFIHDKSFPEVYTYEEHMTSAEYYKLCDSTLESYSSWDDVGQYCKPNVFEPTDKIVYSLINANDVYEEDMTSERSFVLKSRAMQPPHFHVMKNLFLQDDRFIDLGDSRDLSSTEDVINKFNTCLQSQFYIGAPCTWSRFCNFYNIERYHLLDVGAKKEFEISYEKRINLMREVLN